jgi:nucleotide-binding universal stress UspA family protein
MFERIVVPLDGSRLSTQAVPYATEIGKRFGAEIILVRVISPDDLALVPEVQDADNYNSADIMQKEETDNVDNVAYAKRYLTNWSQSLKSQGIKVSYEVLAGNPAKTIMLFSKTQQASLIVMMSHGQGAFRRAIMGSVADEILRHSSIPVLIVRTPNLGDN